MNPIPLLRRVGQIEAVSFLLLIGVAMPLKYLAGQPLAVKIVGWAHGVLFVIFGCALLPFGPFVVDRRMREWEGEFEARAGAGRRSDSLATDEHG